MDDRLHAYCNYKTVHVHGAETGSLVGYDFAVKDIFDIAGYVTGASNPDCFTRMNRQQAQLLPCKNFSMQAPVWSGLRSAPS